MSQDKHLPTDKPSTPHCDRGTLNVTDISHGGFLTADGNPLPSQETISEYSRHSRTSLPLADDPPELSRVTAIQLFIAFVIVTCIVSGLLLLLLYLIAPDSAPSLAFTPRLARLLPATIIP